MFRSRTGMIALALLAVAAAAGGTVWALRGPSVDPQVQQIKQLTTKLMPGPDRSLDDKERDKLREELRAQVATLSDEQRQELRQQQREMFQHMMRERIAKFHALPKEEQTAFLDAEIDRMEEFRARLEERREQWRQRREAEQAEAGEQAAASDIEGAAGQSESANRRPGREATAASSEGGATANQAGQGRAEGERGERWRGRENWRSLPPEERKERRNDWRRERLAATTPQERAQFAAYIEALRQRRKERGLSDVPFPWDRRRR